MPRASQDWTPERVSQIRTLWAQGDSTALIGTKMGISKNAVVGKAHRLKLTPRPSPIRAGTAKPKQPRVVGRKPTLDPPVLRSVLPQPAPTSSAPVLPCEPPPVADRAHRDGGGSCCWPLGEPGRPGFRFCGCGTTGRGRPYCEDHEALAYIRMPRAKRTGEGTGDARA